MGWPLLLPVLTPVSLRVQLVRGVGYADLQDWVGFTNEFKTRFEGLSSQVVCLDCIDPYCCLCCTVFIPNVGISVKKTKLCWWPGRKPQCRCSLPVLFTLFNSELRMEFPCKERLLLGIVSALSFNTKLPGQAKRMQWMEAQDGIVDDWIKVGKTPIFQAHFEYLFWNIMKSRNF